MNNSIRHSAKLWLSILLVSILTGTASAAKPAPLSPLATDLTALVTEAETVNTQLAGITLTGDNLCNELLTAHQSAEALIINIENVNASLTAPLSTDADALQALDDLSAVFVSMANASTGLSLDLATLNNTTDMLNISSGLTAMLRLSDDIGTMADRILEMSDKILVMADNIGLMADRIIVTQQIQSDNLALTQASLLATQQNALALVSVVNTSTYENDFNAQTLAGNILTADIATTLLTTLNMANQWAAIATDADGLKTQVAATHEAITAAAKANTLYVDVNSYTALADMGIMVSSMTTAMQGLMLATEGLSSATDPSTLDASMNSVLQLSADIGVMADRILEMADLILAMSDNIGLTADQIIATQQLQSTNYAATLASVEIMQAAAISIIAVNSL